MNDMAGSIEGDMVILQSSVRIIGDSIVYTFNGTLSGGIISGNLFMGEYRSAKFTATKNNKPASKKAIFVPSGAPLSS